MASLQEEDYVLLGFTENECLEKPSFKDNFIGGTPILSSFIADDELASFFSRNHLTCKTCEKVMSFIGQISCPVEDDFDRVLYSFSCTTKGCSKKSWSVCRVTTPYVASEKETKAKNAAFDEDEWEDQEDDTADSGKRVGSTVSSKNIPLSSEVSKFKGYYLVVEEEDYLLEEEAKKSKKSGNGVKIDDASEAPNENYEKFLIPGTDEVSNKFIKRISKFPAQIVRYNLNGSPLLNQTKIVEEVEKCHSCASLRRFELQFTPGLIDSLELLDKNQSFEMDFGTVLIYTCQSDCREKMLHWEEALVLDDPDCEAITSKLGT